MKEIDLKNWMQFNIDNAKSLEEGTVFHIVQNKTIID